MSSLLFNVYMKLLGEIVEEFGMIGHQYIDDTQLGFCLRAELGVFVEILNRCLEKVMKLMQKGK